ncbi:MAG: pantoate kinase [Halobacteriota archaeon]
MKAFCPFHITGFFALTSDQKKVSSIGCGVVIADGAVTEVSEGLGSVYINQRQDPAPTTKTAAAWLSDKTADIWTELAGPMGCGLGTSGAGALSSVIALNEFWKLKHSFKTLCDIAQWAEIKNNTGVGDVVAEALGGMVVREPSAVFQIPAPPLEISYVVFGPLPTPEILADKEKIAIINKFGSIALQRLLKRPTFKEFMQLSIQFARDTELISPKAQDAVEAVEANDGLASMAMLGDSVYAVDPANALNAFGKVRKTKIFNRGAHLTF